jgi:hypothetical protein
LSSTEHFSQHGSININATPAMDAVGGFWEKMPDVEKAKVACVQMDISAYFDASAMPLFSAYGFRRLQTRRQELRF